MKEIGEFFQPVIDNIEKVIIGKRDTIELLLVALLSEGHVLIEDVPGVGKTMLARALAASFGAEYKRVQCTPDLLPNDITGVSVFNQKTGGFEFHAGPVFVNVLLADEINRATPRTQSALLEAMQEQQVTVDGATHLLPRPFIVLATQNPIEYEGTFPLPEAQLDRFLMKIAVGYPAREDERKILVALKHEHPIQHIQPVASLLQLRELQKLVGDVFMDQTLEEYILELVNATRNHYDLVLGGSPRASLALYKTCQSYAAFQGRDFVLPEDVKRLVIPTLSHRLIVRPEAELRGRSSLSILKEIIDSTTLSLGIKESSSK